MKTATASGQYMEHDLHVNVTSLGIKTTTPSEKYIGGYSPLKLTDQNCHPLWPIYWMNNTLMGILTLTYCNKGSKLPTRLVNIWNRILTWTYLHSAWKQPPCLANIWNRFLTSSYLHKGSKLPRPPATISNRILTSTYLHGGGKLPPRLSNTLVRIVTKTYFHTGSKLPLSLATISNRILTSTYRHEGSPLKSSADGGKFTSAFCGCISKVSQFQGSSFRIIVSEYNSQFPNITF